MVREIENEGRDARSFAATGCNRRAAYVFSCTSDMPTHPFSVPHKDCSIRLDSQVTPVSGTAAAAAGPSSGEPPSTVAGFTFGSPVAEAKTLCEGSGKTWVTTDAAHASCSGPAEDIGFDSPVGLKVCEDRLCGLTLTTRPSSETKQTRPWVDRLGELREALVHRYGRFDSSDSEIPSGCLDGEVLPCFERGLKVAYNWKWGGGQRLKLQLAKANEVPAIVIEYTGSGTPKPKGL
jgi:hypothetical protein